ncbi:hypothetical protein AgCh_017142 [Apium graveolens]
MGRNQKTFRPKKSAPSGSKGAQLQKHIDATLGSGNLKEAVRLPPGEDLNEWLAVNSKYEYRWADGVTIKKPIEVSAPKYVEYLMDWIETQLDDESIFPQKLGTPFPPNFVDVVKTIFKRLFRVEEISTWDYGSGFPTLKPAVPMSISLVSCHYVKECS